MTNTPEAFHSRVQATQRTIDTVERLNGSLLEGSEKAKQLGEALNRAEQVAKALKARVGRANQLAHYDTVRKVAHDTRPAEERDAEINALRSELSTAQETFKAFKSKLGAVRQSLHFDRMRRTNALKVLRDTCEQWSRFSEEPPDSMGRMSWAALSKYLETEEARDF